MSNFRQNIVCRRLFSDVRWAHCRQGLSISILSISRPPKQTIDKMGSSASFPLTRLGGLRVSTSAAPRSPAQVVKIVPPARFMDSQRDPSPSPWSSDASGRGPEFGSMGGERWVMWLADHRMQGEASVKDPTVAWCLGCFVQIHRFGSGRQNRTVGVGVCVWIIRSKPDMPC